MTVILQQGIRELTPTFASDPRSVHGEAMDRWTKCDTDNQLAIHCNAVVARDVETTLSCKTLLSYRGPKD